MEFAPSIYLAISELGGQNTRGGQLVRIPQFIHSFFVCMLFGLMVPLASGQPANETQFSWV